MLSDLYTPKQLDTFRFAVNNDYFMLINHGAKRTGKTVLDNDLFLYELRRIKKIAAAQGVENPQYILAGADLGVTCKIYLEVKKTLVFEERGQKNGEYL